MKKILMTLAAVAVAATMNAQVYVGGSVGIASYGGDGVDEETAFKLLPEVGYNLNDEWAIGTVIGYEKNAVLGAANTVSEKAFVIAPYARYTFLNSKYVNLFVDGGVEFKSASDADATYLGVGLKPGVAVNLSDNISFVAHAGFIGYNLVNPDGDNNNTHAWGLDLGSENLTFGLYFNF